MIASVYPVPQQAFYREARLLDERRTPPEEGLVDLTEAQG